MKETDKLHELIEKYRNVLVVVEGAKDEKALESLGFRKILAIKKPLYEVAEQVVEKLAASGCKECILLTDLDREGRKIYARLNSDLNQKGIKVNNELRNFLFKYTKLRQIEGILNYFQRRPKH